MQLLNTTSILALNQALLESNSTSVAMIAVLDAMEIFNPNPSARLLQFAGLLTMGLSTSEEARDSEGPGAAAKAWLKQLDQPAPQGAHEAALAAVTVPRLVNSITTPDFLARLGQQYRLGDPSAEYAVQMIRRGSLDTYVEDAYVAAEGEFLRDPSVAGRSVHLDEPTCAYATAPDQTLETGRPVSLPALSHSEVASESKVAEVAEEWLRRRQSGHGSPRPLPSDESSGAAGQAAMPLGDSDIDAVDSTLRDAQHAADVRRKGGSETEAFSDIGIVTPLLRRLLGRVQRGEPPPAIANAIQCLLREKQDMADNGTGLPGPGSARDGYGPAAASVFTHDLERAMTAARETRLLLDEYHAVCPSTFRGLAAAAIDQVLQAEQVDDGNPLLQLVGPAASAIGICRPSGPSVHAARWACRVSARSSVPRCGARSYIHLHPMMHLCTELSGGSDSLESRQEHAI